MAEEMTASALDVLREQLADAQADVLRLHKEKMDLWESINFPGGLLTRIQELEREQDEHKKWRGVMTEIADKSQQQLVELDHMREVASHVKDMEKRAEAAEQRALSAEKDVARMDWLESEGKREGATKNYDSLFRRNVPITRAAIDAAIGERERG
jgi:DNA repair ATPase RecN